MLKTQRGIWNKFLPVRTHTAVLRQYEMEIRAGLSDTRQTRTLGVWKRAMVWIRVELCVIHTGKEAMDLFDGEPRKSISRDSPSVLR